MKKTTLLLGAASVAFTLACSGSGDGDETITIEAPAVEEAAEEAAVEEPAEEAVEAAAVEEPAPRERRVKKGSKTKGR